MDLLVRASSVLKGCPKGGVDKIVNDARFVACLQVPIPTTTEPQVVTARQEMQGRARQVHQIDHNSLLTRILALYLPIKLSHFGV